MGKENSKNLKHEKIETKIIIIIIITKIISLRDAIAKENVHCKHIQFCTYVHRIWYLRPYIGCVLSFDLKMQYAVCKICSIFFLFSLAFLSLVPCCLCFFIFLVCFCVLPLCVIHGHENALRTKIAVFVRLLCVHFIRKKSFLFLSFRYA